MFMYKERLKPVNIMLLSLSFTAALCDPVGMFIQVARNCQFHREEFETYSKNALNKGKMSRKILNQNS